MDGSAGVAAPDTPWKSGKTIVETHADLRRREPRDRACSVRAHPLAGGSAVRIRASLLQPLRHHDLGFVGAAPRRQLDGLAGGSE